MSQAKDKMSEIDEHIMKRFDIQKRLGKGAYGIVWKAIDRKTKEVVAVKKIFDAFRNQTDAQRTFREIMFLQSFKRHPNIIRLHSIHRAANNKDIYLGFEYMETDLHNVIKRGNILKDIHKCYIMYQLLKATKYIHSGNVIHRDQKPSNILLDSMCRCKIADFGLARSLTQTSEGSPSDTDPTLTDYVATRWYRAPEILIANRHYTKGIDMWSLGCILGEMLAGKPVFPGSSTVNQVEKIMATIPVPSQDDINTVCVSGVGSSMIKNACAAQRIPLHTIIGSDQPHEALDLLNRLLVFNPHKRLTAEQALDHKYVARFHDPQEEFEMNCSVVIPLNDDVRLSVDDYRNKLYELMASHHARYNQSTVKNMYEMKKRDADVSSQIFGTRLNQATNCRSRNGSRTDCQGRSIKISPDIRPKVTKDTERYLKSHYHQREKPHFTQSEPKMQSRHRSVNQTSNHKSDSKISRQILQMPQDCKISRAYGDGRKSQVQSSSELHMKEKFPSRNMLNSRTNVPLSSFNSYNQNHGIITQSALMELRAGMR